MSAEDRLLFSRKEAPIIPPPILPSTFFPFCLPTVPNPTSSAACTPPPFPTVSSGEVPGVGAVYLVPSSDSEVRFRSFEILLFLNTWARLFPPQIPTLDGRVFRSGFPILTSQRLLCFLRVFVPLGRNFFLTWPPMCPC